MALKDILVHVDDGRSNPSRIGVAVHLATVHGAHLTGVYRTPELNADPYLDPSLRLERIDALQTKLAERSAAAEKAFLDAAGRGGVQAEWRSAPSHFASELVAGALYADLIVSGQADPGGADGRMAELFMMGSGRPTLVVPYAGRHERIGRRILIAWNETREATRAVHDALPLLERAEQVHVLTIEHEGERAAAATASSTALCHHLARHSVKAESHHVVNPALEVGDTLVSRATELEADMIVMGAYGHSRLREVVLGGATRDVLRQMTVPVLMSH